MLRDKSDDSMNSLATRIKPAWSIPLIGAFVLGAVVLITYYPALGLGFSPDDFMWLNWGGRLPLSQYFLHSIDAADFRPLQAAQWQIAYRVWGDNFAAYHLLNVLFHLGVCLLLYRLVARISKRWSMALVAGLLYATFVVLNYYGPQAYLANQDATIFLVTTHYSIAVLAPGVPDPLETVFYLLAIDFWLTYLHQRDQGHYGLTLLATLCALLTKELGVTLPIVLFLIDRLLVPNSGNLKTLLRRYTPFVLLLTAYLPFAYLFHSRSPYTQTQYSLSNPWLLNLMEYLQATIFPWGSNGIFTQAALLAVLVACLYAAIIKHNKAVAFLALGAVVTLLPVIPFYFVSARYVYLPLTFSAAAFAWLVIRARQILKKWGVGLIGGSVALVVFGNGLAIAREAADFSQVFQQSILPFASIFERHRSFPAGTLLYFIDPPIYSLQVAGLLLPPYGRSVTVSSTDQGTRAGLHDHNTTLIFFFDDQGNVREQPVGASGVIGTRPNLPVRFEEGIGLDGFELAGGTIKRGETIVLILYWKAEQKVDRNYTIFAHLVNSDGQTIEGYDSEPQGGRAPTTFWRPNQTAVTAAVIPVPYDAPVGDSYRLEVGLYYLPTMHRLGILDPQSQLATDTIVIEPLGIVR